MPIYLEYTLENICWAVCITQRVQAQWQSYSYIAKKKKELLTFGIREEVTIHWFGDCSQRVTGLQRVVAIVEVGRVLYGQAALQIVLVEVHLGSNVVILQDLLLVV